MKKVKTDAQTAAEEFSKYVGHQNKIYEPWQLEGHLLEPVHIEGTVDDVLLISKANAYVRPNFEITEEKVEIPNLFSKFNGDIDGFYEDLKDLQSDHAEKMVIYDSYARIAKPPRNVRLAKRPAWFSKEDGIDIDRAIGEDLGPLRVLRPSYRRNYLIAINRVLAIIASDDYLGERPTARDVLEVLLFNSNKIIKMYHQFDYQYFVPKFVIKDIKAYTITPFAVIRMLMMHCLGFDVFVLSAKGYASIENYLSDEICNVHYLTERERVYTKSYQERTKFQSLLKPLLILTVVIIVLMLIFDAAGAFFF